MGEGYIDLFKGVFEAKPISDGDMTQSMIGVLSVIHPVMTTSRKVCVCIRGSC